MPARNATSERNVAIMLDDLIADARDAGEAPDVRNVQSFNMAGIMTPNAGFVMTMDNGSEFQVTVVRSR